MVSPHDESAFSLPAFGHDLRTRGHLLQAARALGPALQQRAEAADVRKQKAKQRLDTFNAVRDQVAEPAWDYARRGAAAAPFVPLGLAVLFAPHRVLPTVAALAQPILLVGTGYRLPAGQTRAAAAAAPAAAQPPGAWHRLGRKVLTYGVPAALLGTAVGGCVHLLKTQAYPRLPADVQLLGNRAGARLHNLAQTAPVRSLGALADGALLLGQYACNLYGVSALALSLFGLTAAGATLGLLQGLGGYAWQRWTESAAQTPVSTQPLPD